MAKKKDKITWKDFVPPIVFKLPNIINLDMKTVNTTQIGLSIFFLGTVLLTIVITNIIPNVVANTVYTINVASYKVPHVKSPYSQNAQDSVSEPKDVLGVKDDVEHNEAPSDGKLEIKEGSDGCRVSFTDDNDEKTSISQTSVSAYTYYSYGL